MGKKTVEHAIVQTDMLGLCLRTVCGLKFDGAKWVRSWSNVTCKRCLSLRHLWEKK